MVSTILSAWIPVSHLSITSSNHEEYETRQITKTKTETKTESKKKTPLLGDVPTFCLVVKEDDVDLLGQLRHRGEDEGERGDDHHCHRGERTNLEKRMTKSRWRLNPFVYLISFVARNSQQNPKKKLFQGVLGQNMPQLPICMWDKKYSTLHSFGWQMKFDRNN